MSTVPTVTTVIAPVVNTASTTTVNTVAVVSDGTPQAPSINPSDVTLLTGANRKDEHTYGALLASDVTEFHVMVTPAVMDQTTKFIVYGTAVTKSLGAGERRALVRDVLETIQRLDIPLSDFDRVASGQIPKTRNVTNEKVQLTRVRTNFRTIFGHDPNFKDATENLAWNTLMYRIRFPRDLIMERQGITRFKNLYKKQPTTPLMWAIVRLLGYVKK